MTSTTDEECYCGGEQDYEYHTETGCADTKFALALVRG